MKTFGGDINIKEDFLSYIHTNIGESPFILLLLIGSQGIGKSTLVNFLIKSNGKKEKFKVVSSANQEAEIAYAGKIGDIIINTRCQHLLNENPHLLDNNYHVFICDTEGIKTTTKGKEYATYIFPFMHLASKIVYFTHTEPSITTIKYLEMLEKYSGNIGKTNSISENSKFDDKLIIRVSNFPKLISTKLLQQTYINEEEEDVDEEKEVPQYTLDEAIEKLKHSDLAGIITGEIKRDNGTGLSIQWVPGGPWTPQDMRSLIYNQCLVSLLLNNIDPGLVFTPQKFCDIFHSLYEEYQFHKEKI